MRIEVFKSIEGIHEAWDRLAPRDRIVLESRHLLAIERSGVNAIDPYYLLVYDGRRLAGIVHGFIMKLDVASIDKSVPPDALATLRCWNRDFLNEPIFECGIVSGLGRTIAASDADLSQVCHAAANEMTRLALEAGAEFVLVRDVPYSMLQDHAAFLEEGYAPLLGFPIAKMAARWVSFDAYLDALKSHTRQDIRRAMSRRPAGVDVVYVSDFADHAERLAELWAQTSRRAADYSHEKLNPDYFREIQLCLPDRSRVIALKRRETIVAFVLSLIGDEEYFAVHCGVDQAGSERDNLYDFLMMTVIRDAFDQKRRLLNWGITTYDYKFKRGFEADPMIYFLKHVRQPCLTAALARGFQKGIRQPNNLHRPFKDQGLTRRPDWKALAAALPVTSSPQATDVLGKAYGYDRIDSMRLGSIYSFCPAFENAQGPIVRYRGRDVVMLGSNAYLGLGTHQKVIAAAKAAIDKYGTGCSGSPLLNGTLDLHVDLAGALADFMQKEEALLCSTGYQTNVGVVSAIVGKGDVVIMDRLNHASLVDGARLSGAEIMRYRHNDMDSLELALKRRSGRGKFVVVDSVFSMEGTIADLPTIVELARKHGARTMVDEAHAIGVLGPKGRGAAEHFGVLDQVDIVMATFSKSLASIGGFVAADAKVIDYLRHVARSHIFSASLPPAAVAAVRAALEIVKTEPGRRRKLLENAAYMSARLQELGFDAPCHRTAVVPIHCDNDVLTLGAFKMLLERGVFVNPVLEPAVPKGRELLRTSYMATHTREMLDRALAIFAEVRTPLFPKRVPAHARPAQAAPSLHVRPMVFLPVVDRRSFAHYYSDASPRGLLRVPGFTRLEIGQPVDCGVSFGTEDLIVQSEGRIISKSLKPQLGRPLGIEVELAATESHARDLLNRILNGEAVRLAKRRSWRYHAAAIDAEYSVDGAALVGAVDDISLEGAAVRSQHGFKRGTRVPLRLKPPAGTPIDVAGEVRWCREGEDPAFGVLFCFASPAERYRLGALIGSIQHALSGIAA